MPKTHFNKMIIGNSGMLGCIDERGELVRLFWPDIDYYQHIDRLLAGITCSELWQGAKWLESADWSVNQHYIEDTNIAVTLYENKNFGIKITQTDFVIPDRDVLERRYTVENTGASTLTIGFVLYSSSVSTVPQPAGILFDDKLSALIHYKHNYYYSISSDKRAAQYQLGGNAFGNASNGELRGSDTIGMMASGALIWEKEAIEPGETGKFTLNICFAHELYKLKNITREIINADSCRELDKTIQFWRDYLSAARVIRTGNDEIDRLYKRSILVFALMENKRTGALLAAPEVDEEFTRCGRYAFCWGRDAAFIASAMDICGLSDSVERFYRWTAKVQAEDGSWQQRYYTDGNLAPSWGYQADEGGSIIWGILKHYEVTKNKEFLKELWPCVKKGVEFLTGYVDRETGLPWLSFDLWEERLGEHAYSTAAVCAGVEAGIKIAEILAEEDEDFMAEHSMLINSWRECAISFRKSLERYFWHYDWNRFMRSVRVKLNGFGEEHTDSKVWLKVNDISIVRDYSLTDGTLDVSLLGLCIPFELYDSEDSKMVSTAQALEQVLTVYPTGGLMRYEHDGYMGGNPWIVATLWAALYHIKRKSFEKAREYLNWAVRSSTEQGLLPEQADRESGRPAWVIPLTWSHAMFVLVVDGLMREGEI